MQTGVPAILLGTHGTRVIIHGKRGVCPWLRSKEIINIKKRKAVKSSKAVKNINCMRHMDLEG